MASRKSLLFLTDVYPFPLDRGQRVRIWNLLAACGRVCDVTFVGPPPPEPSLGSKEISEYCRHVQYLGTETSVGWGRASRLLRAARIAPGVPSAIAVRRYEAFMGALDRVRPDRFDLVWAERPHIARLCAPYRSRAIMDLDDVEHLKIARRLGMPQKMSERLHDRYRYHFYRRLELSWSRSFLATVVCSQEDHEYLRANKCTNSIVVPNGPNVAEINGMLTPPSRVDGRSLRMVFLGNVGSEPNLDAIAFLARDILPMLQTRVPGASLDVIGPEATAAVAERFAPNIRFRGFVEDLSAAFAEYDMMLAPIRFGSGTKLKILDAMARGLPVVTTAVGAEGLSVSPGVHYAAAETALDIVTTVEDLWNNPTRARQLAENAFALVQDKFSWRAIQERLSNWLERLEPRAAY